MAFWFDSGTSNIIMSGSNVVDCAKCPCGGPEAGTIATDCCPSRNLPTTLFAQITDNNNMACVGVTVVTLTYGICVSAGACNGMPSWSGTATMGTCGHDITVTLWCNTGTCGGGSSSCNGWWVYVTFPDACGSATPDCSTVDATPCSCNPFQAHITNVGVDAGCGGTGITNGIDIDILE